MRGILCGMDQKDTSTSEILASWLSPWYLAVTFSAFFAGGTLEFDFLGDDFDEFLYSALCLVRLSIHALRQFMELLMTLTLSTGGLWKMTSRSSPYSALSLVRQRIHAVRQSTRLSGKMSYYFSWFPGDDFMFVSVFSA